MIVATRGVSTADADELDRLARLSSLERSAERGGLLLDRIEPRPPINPASAFVLLGLIDEVAFGFVQTHIDEVDGLGRVAVIDDLFVEPAAREVGVGESLMDGLLNWARASGCSAIDGVVLPGNRAGKNFFERYGLVARAIRVHRRLD